MIGANQWLRFNCCPHNKWKASPDWSMCRWWRRCLLQHFQNNMAALDATSVTVNAETIKQAISEVISELESITTIKKEHGGCTNGVHLPKRRVCLPFFRLAERCSDWLEESVCQGKYTRPLFKLQIDQKSRRYTVEWVNTLWRMAPPGYLFLTLSLTLTSVK